MEYRRLGTTDLEISVVGLGCWAIGGGQWGGTDDDESIATIRQALDLGVNLLDTSEMYSNGHSDELIARALEGRKREEVVIATKVAPYNCEYDDVKKSLEGSLTRLQVDYVDLFQIHWPPKVCPIAEAMRAMTDLQEEGKLRHVGVSNFSVPQLEEALAAGRVESSQPPYSLFWRFAEDNHVPFCLDHGISVLAYSPMAQGLLTGKFSPQLELAEDDVRRHNVLFQGEVFQKALEAIDRIRPIAEEHGKTLAQTSVRWLLQQPAVTCALMGARHPGQVAENVGAADWELPQEDLDAIDQIGRTVTDALPRHDTLWGPLWY